MEILVDYICLECNKEFERRDEIFILSRSDIKEIIPASSPKLINSPRCIVNLNNDFLTFCSIKCMTVYIESN